MNLPKAVTPDEMRDIEKALISQLGMPSLLLMENAARGVAEVIVQDHTPCTTLVLCGIGNNGGDGFAVARHLNTAGFDVKVIIYGNLEQLQGDAKTNFEILTRLGTKPISIEENTNLEEIFMQKSECIIIDALLGTGLSRDVDGVLKQAILQINTSGYPIYSVDIPSGIDGQSGHIRGAAIKATKTVTFQNAKMGHLLYPGREYTSRLIIKNLGVQTTEEKRKRDVFFAGDQAKILSHRSPYANKSSSGKLAVIAGSEGLCGAGELCVRAALRSGAGMVTAGVPHMLLDVFESKFTEAMTYALPGRDGKICLDALPAIESLLSGKDAAAIGPGIGKSDDLQALIAHVIINTGIPLVIDADGLNNLAPVVECLKKRKAATIITPHPIEMSRLMHAPAETVLDAPVEAAEQFAREYGVVVALKCGTHIVASPDGRTTFCLSGNAGMATGGSGDVMTGVILALLGSGLDAYDAARFGCHVNGMAGDAAAREIGTKGMLPSDTIDQLPQVINLLTL